MVMVERNMIRTNIVLGRDSELCMKEDNVCELDNVIVANDYSERTAIPLHGIGSKSQQLMTIDVMELLVTNTH